MFETVFIVKQVQPRYHHSTNAHIGTTERILDAFSTYQEALDYIAFQNDYDWDNVYLIDFDVMWDAPDHSATYGMTRAMSSLLTVNSYYTGPYDPNAPF